MKKKIVRSLSLLLALACFFSLTVFAEPMSLTANQGNGSPFMWNLQEQYCRLEQVENLVTAQIGEQPLDVQVYLTYPSGKTVNDKSFMLEEGGRYTVKAMADYEGVTYTEEKTFLVYMSLFEVEGGSAVYGNHPYTEITGKSSDISGVKGLLVKIPQGSKLTVTAPLDISKSSNSNPLLQFYVVSSEKGVLDFDFLRFTFTDLYDPSNVLTLTCLNKPNSNNIRQNMNWWHAGATGQNLVGYQNDLGQDKVWMNSVWGTAGIGSFCMMPWSEDTHLIQDKFGIWLDEDLKVYAGRNQAMVCDLDNPKFHTNLWEGFTSDKVMLTVEADGYTGENPAQIFITQMISTDLQAEKVYDTGSPEISLNCAPYGESALPDACVGKAYPIFQAVAADPEVNPTKVNIAVYGGMYSDTRYLVDGRTGCFTPDLPGTYTICYTASDSWGNTTEKYAYVYAREAAGDMTLTLPDKAVSGKVGQKIVLPSTEVTGNFGNPKVEIQVLFGEEVITCQNGGFTPYKDGTYQVTYTVTDYIGQQVSQSYDIQVAKTDEAVFGKLPALNRYMLAGMQNSVPVAVAYDYVTADGKAIDTVTYAEDAVGVHQVSNRSFTPADGSTEVTVWWEATINGKTAVSEKLTVPVVTVKDGEDYKMEKYFLCENAETRAEEDSVVLQLTAEQAKAVWVNPLLAEGFSLIFSPDRVKTCTVLLTDYENPGQKLEIVIDTVTAVAVVNGTRNYPLIKSGPNYILTYDPLSNKLSDGSTSLVPLDEAGNIFGGFTSGKLYLDMSFAGAESGASIKFTSINAQNLSNRPFDMLKPGVSVLGETGGFYVVGDQVTVFKGATADVLSPYCTFYVNVLDPQGQIATDVNGLKMEMVYPDKNFTIALDQIGAYVVQFYSEDADGNKEKNISYPLNVLDMVAPVLSAPASVIPETATVGTKLTVPAVTAMDAVDGELEVFVYVQYPDMRVQTVNGGTVDLTKPGIYVIKYYAFDTSGNSEILEYTVTVS